MHVVDIVCSLCTLRWRLYAAALNAQEKKNNNKKKQEKKNKRDSDTPVDSSYLTNNSRSLQFNINVIWFNLWVLSTKLLQIV